MVGPLRAVKAALRALRRGGQGGPRRATEKIDGFFGASVLDEASRYREAKPGLHYGLFITDNQGTAEKIGGFGEGGIWAGNCMYLTGLCRGRNDN